MTNDPRILAALIQARLRLANATRESWERVHSDARPIWTGVVCPSCGVDYRTVSAVDGRGIEPGELTEDEVFDDIFSVTRKLVIPSQGTAKASSAEAILRRCLRAVHLTTTYRQGALSYRQQFKLLEEIRQYGRAWLRHEAEEFTRRFVDVRENSRGIQDDHVSSMESGVCRAASWVEGSGGYLIFQDSGFRHAVNRFFNRAKSFVRELILAGTMALSGPAPLTGEELAGADQEAQRQEQFFDKFHGEVIQPREKPVAKPVDTTSYFVTAEPAPMTPGQFVARAELYGNSAWTSALNVGRANALKDGVFVQERRVHLLAEHEHFACQTCIDQSNLGWQPMGVLLEIGDSECMGNCDCYYEWKDRDGTIHVSPSGRFNPKGHNIPGEEGTEHPGIETPVTGEMLEDTGGVEMIAEPPGGLVGDFPVAGPS